MLKNLKQKHSSEKCPPLFPIRPMKCQHTQAQSKDNTRIYHIHTWQRVKHGERHKSGDGRTFLTPSFHQSAAANHRWMDGLMESPAASYSTTQWHESNLPLAEDAELERAFRVQLQLFAHVCLCVLLYWPGSVVWSLQLDSVCTDEELHLRGGISEKDKLDHLWWILQDCIAAISVCL